MSGSGGALLDQHLISSFYSNYKRIKEQEDAIVTPYSNCGETGKLLLKAESNSNLSNMAKNKLRLKLQRHQKLY